MYSNDHYIGDTFTFYAQGRRDDTGAAADGAAAPAYEVYEEETGTAILSGNMALLNDSGTTGFYSEQITLSTANGFEIGKMYCVRATMTTNSVAQAWVVAVIRIMPDLQKLIRYFVNASSRNANSGTITVRNDGDTADAYTMTETVSGSTVSKGAIS